MKNTYLPSLAPEQKLAPARGALFGVAIGAGVWVLAIVAVVGRVKGWF